MVKRLSQIGEFGLIELLKKSASRIPGVVRGIGDDAAVLAVTSGRQLLFTTDMLVEGVHFTRQMKTLSVGHKALACSMSDIAAMGGVPRYAVVSLGVPGRLPLSYVAEIYRGINALAKKFSVGIVGGDTVSSSAVVINVALLGEAPRRDVVCRSGARDGDWIFVTGPLGGSLVTGKHLTFTPRVNEAQFLVRNFKPHAMIDISDGLAADLGHILDESRVGAILEEKDIPCNQGADLTGALYDGEDFELLFTISATSGKKLLASSFDGMSFYKIGTIVGKKAGLTIVDKKGHDRPLLRKGYKHF